MSLRAAGRALFVALMLCSAFDATTPFLLFAGREHGCSCPIKAPCCQGSFCPMEAARRHHQGASLRSCGGGSSQIAMPNFLQWVLLVPLARGRDPLALVAEAPQGVRAVIAAGVTKAPEQPPRVSFPPLAVS